jgi:hypothetical protein
MDLLLLHHRVLTSLPERCSVPSKHERDRREANSDSPKKGYWPLEGQLVVHLKREERLGGSVSFSIRGEGRRRAAHEDPSDESWRSQSRRECTC